MITETEILGNGAAPLKTSTSQHNTKNGNRSQVFTPNIYLELEKKIIGSILLQPDSKNGPSSISRCQELGLEPQHFSLPAHQTIYRAFLHLAKEDKRTDPYNTTMLLHSWNHPYGDSQLFVARFLEEVIGTHNLDIWAKDLIEIAERRQSVTPESDIERELRGCQVEARELLMDDKISNSERAVRLEALKEKYELTGQTFNNLINPIKKEVNDLKLKLEIKALLQESDPVEKEFKIREIAESYRMSQGTIKSLLTSVKTQTETTQAKRQSLSEFLNAESTAIDWLVPGLLPKGETALLIAPPKCGKTLLAIDLAYCLATGEDYFLNSNEFKTSPSKVLLISVDESDQSTRIKMFNRGFRHEDNGKVDVITNWNINQIKYLEEALEDFRPELVIVDSLKRINHGSPISENSAEFADNIYTLKELFNRYGAAGILVHHSSKDKDQQGVYRSRGSSAITGAVWGVWQLDQMPKPDPDNPKKQIIDPNDLKRRFYAYSRDDVGGSYILEFDPENYSFAINLEGLDEKSQVDKSLPEKIQKLLELNKGSLKGLEIIDLLNKEEADKHSRTSIYKALNRLVAKRVIGFKQCPENKRAKIYYLPDFKGGPNTTTEEVAQACSTQNDFSTPPLPPTSTIEVNNDVTVDESEIQIHDTIVDAAPEKRLTQTIDSDNNAKVSSDNATEFEEQGPAEVEVSAEELAKLEREWEMEKQQLASEDKDAAKSESKPSKKSKSNKSKPKANQLKIGDWVRHPNGKEGSIENINSNGIAWVVVPANNAYKTPEETVTAKVSELKLIKPKS